MARSSAGVQDGTLVLGGEAVLTGGFALLDLQAAEDCTMRTLSKSFRSRRMIAEFNLKFTEPEPAKCMLFRRYAVPDWIFSA